MVYLRWLDSASTEGWRPNTSGGLCEIESIGYLTYEDKMEIRIVQSIADSGYVDGITAIPKSVILKRRTIKTK